MRKPRLPSSAATRLWELGLWALAVAAVAPLWAVEYPPIQDLPQHLAAIRVLHDFAVPELRFARYFEIELGRTQYLSYYVAADLLCYLLDVETANRVLVTLFVALTPLSLRALLQALGKDTRLCVLSFPLAYNAHLILGFLNFLAAIPLAIYAIALAVRQRRSPSTARALAVAALALTCFYTHVVPFALMALGIGLVALQRRARELTAALLPLLPSGIAAVFWLAKSPAGQATLSAAGGADAGPQPVFEAPEVALRQLPRWLTDVLAGDSDLELLYALGALIAASLVTGSIGSLIGRFRREPAETSLDRLGRSLSWRLALLSPCCALLYFVAPSSYDWIWPIAQRFPLLCALLAIVALPRLPRGVAPAVALVGALLSLAHFHDASRAFDGFDDEEVGDFDAALSAIPPGRRVAGLIFDRGSRHVAFSPFIHYVAYYQARKGGAVMFSFADFPQSPFRFREDNRPPRVPPRWEWLPHRVDPARQLDWYEYVLVRGGPGRIARPSSGFEPRYRGQRWSVFQRRLVR